MSNVRTIAAALIILSLTTGCDRFKTKKDQDESESPPLTLTGPDAIVGHWTGGYRPFDDEGKPLSSVRGVEVQFSNAGKFDLFLIDDPTAKAQGEWQAFDNTKVYFTIKSSTISRINASESLLELDYDRTGNSLYFKSDYFELRLSLKKGEETSENQLRPGAGRWICEQSGVVTRLDVTNDYAWRGTISQEGRRTVTLVGTGERNLEGNIDLKVTNSSEAVVDKAILHLILSKESTKLEMSANELTTNLGQCNIGQ